MARSEGGLGGQLEVGLRLIKWCLWMELGPVVSDLLSGGRVACGRLFLVRMNGRWWSLIVGTGPVFVMLRKAPEGASHGLFLSLNVVGGLGSRKVIHR